MELVTDEEPPMLPSKKSLFPGRIDSKHHHRLGDYNFDWQKLANPLGRGSPVIPLWKGTVGKCFKSSMVLTYFPETSAKYGWSGGEKAFATTHL